MKYLSLVFFVFFLASCSSSTEEGAQTYSLPFLATIEKSAPEITQTKEFGDCVEPTVNMCITQVANEIARKENSLPLCEKLQNEDDINSCKFGVIISGLSKENNLSQCDVLSKKYKMECRIASINLLATTENDPSKCDQIGDELFQTDEQETGKNRVDQCKFTIIMQKEDLKQSDCNELKEDAEKQTCISMIKSREASSNSK